MWLITPHLSPSGMFNFRRISSHPPADPSFNLLTRCHLTNITRKIILITSCVTIIQHMSSIQTVLFFFHILSFLIWGMCLNIAEGPDGSWLLADRIYNYSYHPSGALPIQNHFTSSAYIFFLTYTDTVHSDLSIYYNQIAIQNLSRYSFFFLRPKPNLRCVSSLVVPFCVMDLFFTYACIEGIAPDITILSRILLDTPPS